MKSYAARHIFAMVDFNYSTNRVGHDHIIAPLEIPIGKVRPRIFAGFIQL